MSSTPSPALPLSPLLTKKRQQNQALASQTEPTQLEAQTDVAAVTAWLANYWEQPNTFAAYRKESERFMLWVSQVAQRNFADLKHEDLLRYEQFLSDPQPAEHWQMPKGKKYGRGHPQWRPFTGPLSAASRSQSLRILNQLFEWLVKAEHLAHNPLALRARRRRPASALTLSTRILATKELQVIRNYLMWSTTGQESSGTPYLARAMRDRWLFHLLFLTGMRISEVAENGMASFYQDLQSSETTPTWWLRILGKGNKTRRIPVSSVLLSELALYRKVNGLPSLPVPSEPQPLIMSLDQYQRALSRAALHQRIKYVFKRTADYAQTHNLLPEDSLQRLNDASAHWLRHSAGSHMVQDHVDLLHVRDTLGHASIATTNLYLHSNDAQRHQRTSAHHQRWWDQDSSTS